MRFAFAAAASVCILVAATGRSPTSLAAAGEAEWRDLRIITTRSSPLLPGCGLRRVALQMSEFVIAYNAGNMRGAMARIAPAANTRGHSFRLFSSGEPDGSRSTILRRSALAAYLSTRHQRGDRMHLVEVQAGIDRAGAVYAYFTLALLSADAGSAAMREVVGKASLNCPGRGIWVWSMSAGVAFPTDYPSSETRLCPLPSGWRPGDGIVACTKRRG